MSWRRCAGLLCVTFLLFCNALAADEPKVILFLGNSLSAGFGVDPSQAFPALIQKKIDEQKLAYKVINAGLSGETSAGGLRRIDWLLRQKVDILVLELGGNDGLRGISVETMRSNLQGIIDRARAKYPDIKIVIAGMQAPPNLGAEYTNAFKNVFPELAQKNRAALVPFLLEGVGGNPKLNLPDGIHPTPEGHRIIAQTVWKVLEPMLKAQK
ncbi:MAG: arylesterase [Candidatus Thermochlorobacter sp.]